MRSLIARARAALRPTSVVDAVPAIEEPPAPISAPAPTPAPPRDPSPLPGTEPVLAGFRDTVNAVAEASLPGLEDTVRHWSDAGRVARYEAVYRQGLAERVPGFVGSVGVDFGSWNGFAAHLMRLLGADRVTGVDVVPEHVAQGRAWTNALDERPLDFVLAEPGRPFRVPLPTRAYDWVTVGQVICSINPGLIEPALDEMVRLLRPGGLLSINDSNNPHVPAVRERLLAQYARHEIGDGTPEDPRGAGFLDRREFIAAAHPDLSAADCDRLARGTAYRWGPEILADVAAWRTSGVAPTSHYEPGVLRAVVHAATGNAATNPTDPIELAAALESRGLRVTISTGPGGPELPEDPAARAAALERAGAFHLHAIRPEDDPGGPGGRDLRFTPFRVTPVDEPDLAAIHRERHRALHLCYGPDHREGPGIDKVPAADFDDFLHVLDRLVATGRHCFLPMREIRRTRSPGGGPIPIAFKHDVDGDLETAVRMAEAQHERGIRATYYILPTAPYYGRFDGDGRFHRFERAGASYRRLQELGHEVGLHLNPYDLYRDRGIDGAEAMLTELDWLRSLGLRIDSAYSHSSASRQGVESIELFRDHLHADPDHMRPGSSDLASTFDHGGVLQPRLILNGRRHGLDHFGEFLLRGDRTYSYWALRSCERWRADDRGVPPYPTGFVGTEAMLRELARQTEAPYHVINIHPLAYGLRLGIDAAAEADARRAPETAAAPDDTPGRGDGARLGRFAPGVLHVAPGADPDGSRRPGRVAATVANEVGCLDHPLEPHRGRPGVVLIGGATFEPHDLPLAASLHGWLRDRLVTSGHGDRTTRSFTHARPPAGHVRRALETAAALGPTAAVVLGLDDTLGPAAGVDVRRHHPDVRLVVLDATGAVDHADVPEADRTLSVAAVLAAAGVAASEDGRLTADATDALSAAVIDALEGR